MTTQQEKLQNIQVKKWSSQHNQIIILVFNQKKKNIYSVSHLFYSLGWLSTYVMNYKLLSQFATQSLK